MSAVDEALLRAGECLLRSRAGAAMVRGLHGFLSRVAPFVPARATIPPERASARVSVEARPSTIPGAGLGLFALGPVDGGVIIGEYAGDAIPSILHVLRLRELSYVALGEPSIDAANHPEVMMRYVCHHPSPGRCNVEIRQDEVRRIHFRTTRPVAPGEEFFADYGDMYWAMQGRAPRAG